MGDSWSIWYMGGWRCRLIKNLIYLLFIISLPCQAQMVATTVSGGPDTQTTGETPGVFNQTISEDKNTAYERGDGSNFTNDDNKNYVYRYTDPANANAIHSGIIFDPVTIPQGATITTAYIEIEANYLSEPDAYFHLYGNDVDDAADFTVEQDVISRDRTTANVAFEGEDLPMAYWGSAIEIKTIIQEIVDRPGWASGQAMCLLLIGDTGTLKKLRYSNECKIHIEYTEP